MNNTNPDPSIPSNSQPASGKPVRSSRAVHQHIVGIQKRTSS
jgi:hypothetical protein